jgi:hypothetical protein
MRFGVGLSPTNPALFSFCFLFSAWSAAFSGFIPTIGNSLDSANVIINASAAYTPIASSGFPVVGTWLSLVEHSLGVRGVGSSNLPVPTISFSQKMKL